MATREGTVRFYTTTDWETKDPSRSFNGGEYSYGRTAKIEYKNHKWVIVGMREWSSADFFYCPFCGSFQSDSDHLDRWHSDPPEYNAANIPNVGTVMSQWSRLDPLDMVNVQFGTV